MEDSDDLLDSLLAAADAQLDDVNKEAPILSTQPTKTQSCKTLKDTDIFAFESNLTLQPKSAKGTFESAVHGGDTDSSDEEGNRNYEDQKYNECGREIKGLLRLSDCDHSTSSNLLGSPKKRISNWTTRPSTEARQRPGIAITKNAASTNSETRDVYMDPIFHMRIINPKISSTLLQERMQGRVAVRFADLSRQILAGNLKGKDWVLCGVLVHKSPPKTSQKGSQYSIWTVTDLKDDIKTVGLFMFNSAHSELWKTLIGTVVGVLNPTIMERRDNSKDVACLSIDTSQKVMIFGDSKDFGICKSTKKSGEKCTSVVNLSNCEFCIYHIKQEYQKCSKRSELQANFAGNGLINLRNKVLGKNEVFYAGKSYMAIPAKKSKKLVTKDNNILHSLNGTGTASAKYKTAKPKVKEAARRLEVNPAERARDLELLKKLGGSSLDAKTNFCGRRSDDISMENSKAIALNVISKLKTKNKEVASVNSVTTKNGQYDLKSDLYVNVDNKQLFAGKASHQVALEDSRKAALSVISKLKEKSGEPPSASQLEAGESQISLEEFEAELDYSDNEDTGATVHVHSVEEEQNQTKSKTVQKSVIQSPSSRGSKSCTSMHVQVKNSSHLSSPKGNPSSKFPLVDKSPIVTTKKSFTVGSALESMTMGVPMLSGPARGDFIDLSKPITSRHVDRAKLKALKFIQRNGPIKKIDPNSTKTTGSLKRSIENVLVDPQKQHAAKKSKLQESEFISDRFKKMMAMTSKHSDLLDIRDDEEKEKYFSKLEIKEKMEEKMANTHKVKCKAVKCLKCKYTSFSASDLCKTAHHPLKVCKKFNGIGSKLLSRGFIQLERRHAAIYRRVKTSLPRRESERKTHPLARHNEILQGVETRLSMLNMTYLRYIEHQIMCFIPGKVLDEIKCILNVVETTQSPPRPLQLLQELRDLSSMAIEHFDEHILPRCREKLEQQSGSPENILRELEVVAGSLTPFTKLQGFPYQHLTSKLKPSTKMLVEQQLPNALTAELHKMKKIAKTHKHHISYLTQNTQKLGLKLRKQNNKLRIQAGKLREQERKLQEQTAKIMGQEEALNEVKKHMEEWEHKYKDLTAELVRARDEILLKTSNNSNRSQNLTDSSASHNQYKSNIKPRVAHILPKHYLGIDLERKRKSSINLEIPLKRSRSPTVPNSASQKGGTRIKDLCLDIPDLVKFEANKPNKADIVEADGDNDEANTRNKTLISSFFNNLLTNSPIPSMARKRKMTDIVSHGEEKLSKDK